jgi:hypothetical protein
MKNETLVAFALLVAAIGLALGVGAIKATDIQADAQKFVMEDLNSKFPAADAITIASAKQMEGPGGAYYSIKASVSEALASACPKLTNYYYNYPEQNFVPSPPEYVVAGCRVCKNSPCVIGFREEAIIASHTLPGTAGVADFMRAYPDARPAAENVERVWQVVWSSRSAGYGYRVSVSEGGEIIGISETS